MPRAAWALYAATLVNRFGILHRAPRDHGYRSVLGAGFSLGIAAAAAPSQVLDSRAQAE